MQRSVGNQAMNRLLRSGTIQRKREISHPGDPLEREADRIAEQILRQPIGTGLVQQKTSERMIQRQAVPEPEEMPRRPGAPLPYREAMEMLHREALGTDFSVSLIPPETNPEPDHSQTEEELGAWERARFLFTPEVSFESEAAGSSDGRPRSFAASFSYRLLNPRFQLFIARHLWENRRDRARSDGHVWITIYSRVYRHAIEHFTRFRSAMAEAQAAIQSDIRTLPRRTDPLAVSRGELETYLDSLARYMTARLRYRLWDTTCSWEREDYPRLLRGIPSVSGRLVPACDPAPAVPPVPLPPAPITGRSGP
jgi:hypothetical protein